MSTRDYNTARRPKTCISCSNDVGMLVFLLLCFRYLPVDLTILLSNYPTRVQCVDWASRQSPVTHHCCSYLSARLESILALESRHYIDGETSNLGGAGHRPAVKVGTYKPVE